MSFQLVIAEGKEAGREFIFTQPSVLIGRTTECDVVLYDAGVSRRHARIFNEGDAYFVEDMGSANGTKVNSSVVHKQKLSTGDAISLGPVVFTFSPVALAPEPSTDAGPLAVPSAPTRVVSASELKRSRAQVAMVPGGSSTAQLEKLGRANTVALEAVVGSKARASRTDLERSVSRLAPTENGQRLAAADKARLVRHSGPFGHLRVYWLEASRRKRRNTKVAVWLSVVALAALVVVLVLMPRSERKLKNFGPEPALLTSEKIEESFGLGSEGDPVNYPRADQKTFDFDFKAPVRAVVVIHFQSRDISSGEVLVSVNGADVGSLPPDTMAVGERENELLVPEGLLKKGPANKVVFDNVKNPPESNTWRIWNVWVETALLPELPDDQLISAASARITKGNQLFERRDIGASNRWDAYRAFREAWQMLQALPDPKPPAYDYARNQMRTAHDELDRQCAKVLLEARSAYNQRRFSDARSSLDHVQEFFPSRDYSCQQRAEAMGQEWGL